MDLRQLAVSYTCLIGGAFAEQLVGRARATGDNDDAFDVELEAAYRAHLISEHLVGIESHRSLRVEVTDGHRGHH